jgi:hypothetical protein
MNISVYETGDGGSSPSVLAILLNLWRIPLNGRQLVLKTRVVLGLGVRFLYPPPWEVGEAGAHVPLKMARRRFNSVNSHSP